MVINVLWHSPDFGGGPFENVMKNIELIGNEIIPAIKKHLSK